MIRLRLSIIGIFMAFLRVKTDAPWVRIAAMTAGAVGIVTVLAWIMVLEFPAGLLQDVLALPWPID